MTPIKQLFGYIIRDTNGTILKQSFKTYTSFNDAESAGLHHYFDYYSNILATIDIV